MKQQEANARRIREIKPHARDDKDDKDDKESPVFFEKLLELMDVRFVKNKELTILPFPFKYLREYAKSL